MWPQFSFIDISMKDDILAKKHMVKDMRVF